MSVRLLVRVKGGAGSGNWGHGGMAGVWGGSSASVIKAMPHGDVERYYFHRSRQNTDAVLASGIIRGGDDNFSPRVYQDWRGLENQSVVFAVPKENLFDFRTTMTNQVASNRHDTLLSDPDVKVVVYDKLGKSYYDVTDLYDAGVTTERELIEAWSK